MSLTDFLDDVLPGTTAGQSLGACLIANDLPFQGQAGKILQMRIDGKSWKEIGDEFGKSPSGARKLFTDLTGIKDYKIKGLDLKKMVDSDLDSLKVAKPKVPKKPKTETVDDIVNESKVTPDDFKQKGINGDMDSADLFDEFLADLEDWSGLDMVGDDIYDLIIDGYNKGKTYTMISQQTGLTLAQVDRALWNHLLNVNKGDVWKAWQAKKTSQEGIKAVTEKIMKARAKGASIDDIVQASGIPKDVVTKILKGEWKHSPFANPLAGEIGFKPPLPKPHPKPKSNPANPPLSMGQPPPPGQVVSSPYYGSSDFPMLDIQAMSAMNPTLTQAEIQALGRYSGSYYTSVNSYLRNGQPSSAAGTVSRIDSAMAKSRTTAPMTVTRGMDSRGFGMGYIEDLKSLKGTTMADQGFMSTSNHINGVFQNQVRLEIECPPGTRGIYIKPYSSHSHELEFLMDRNQQMVITEVIKLPPPHIPGTSWLVKARVVV